MIEVRFKEKLGLQKKHVRTRSGGFDNRWVEGSRTVRQESTSAVGETGFHGDEPMVASKTSGAMVSHSLRRARWPVANSQPTIRSRALPSMQLHRRAGAGRQSACNDAQHGARGAIQRSFVQEAQRAIHEPGKDAFDEDAAAGQEACQGPDRSPFAERNQGPEIAVCIGLQRLAAQ